MQKKNQNTSNWFKHILGSGYSQAHVLCVLTLVLNQTHQRQGCMISPCGIYLKGLYWMGILIDNHHELFFFSSKSFGLGIFHPAQPVLDAEAHFQHKALDILILQGIIRKDWWWGLRSGLCHAHAWICALCVAHVDAWMKLGFIYKPGLDRSLYH